MMAIAHSMVAEPKYLWAWLCTYRRICLISACAYNSKRKGNMDVAASDHDRTRTLQLLQGQH